MQFFEALQNYAEVDDVDYGADPPDFEIRLGGQTIGVELTRLNPKPFAEGGYREIAKFKQWESEGNKDQSQKRVFPWGDYTLRESLTAFQLQVERKAKEAHGYAGRHDEAWLLFRAESGSPAGGLLEGKFNPKSSHKESVMNFAGKQLFEMDKICKTAFPFCYVILFCGPNLLAFRVGESSHKLPGPNAELLDRGAQASDDFLKWTCGISSVQWRYDESQGDLAAWMNKRPEDLP